MLLIKYNCITSVCGLSATCWSCGMTWCSWQKWCWGTGQRRRRYRPLQPCSWCDLAGHRAAQHINISSSQQLKWMEYKRLIYKVSQRSSLTASLSINSRTVTTSSSKTPNKCFTHEPLWMWNVILSPISYSYSINGLKREAAWGETDTTPHTGIMAEELFHNLSFLWDNERCCITLPGYPLILQCEWGNADVATPSSLLLWNCSVLRLWCLFAVER